MPAEKKARKSEQVRRDTLPYLEQRGTKYVAGTEWKGQRGNSVRGKFNTRKKEKKGAISDPRQKNCFF